MSHYQLNTGPLIQGRSTNAKWGGGASGDLWLEGHDTLDHRWWKLAMQSRRVGMEYTLAFVVTLGTFSVMTTKLQVIVGKGVSAICGLAFFWSVDSTEFGYLATNQ